MCNIYVVVENYIFGDKMGEKDEKKDKKGAKIVEALNAINGTLVDIKNTLNELLTKHNPHKKMMEQPKAPENSTEDEV